MIENRKELLERALAQTSEAKGHAERWGVDYDAAAACRDLESIEATLNAALAAPAVVLENGDTLHISRPIAQPAPATGPSYFAARLERLALATTVTDLREACVALFATLHEDSHPPVEIRPRELKELLALGLIVEVAPGKYERAVADVTFPAPSSEDRWPGRDMFVDAPIGPGAPRR